MTELWTMGISYPGISVRQAAAAEAAGWDGILFVDSQSLAGDTYVALALAAHATSGIELGSGVTNPVTRHPAVAASAIATVQMESKGRAVLGIGRGDSALAYIGLAPAPVEEFGKYLVRLQGYLRGEPVEPERGTIDDLPLERRPDFRINWIARAGPKVPVDVAATGPRVITLGARLAERVTFAVGADPERVKWAVDLARKEREDVSLGAYVNVVVHPDKDEARRLSSGGVASFARFSAMHGRATGPVGEGDRDVMEGIVRSYDMVKHTRGTATHTSGLTDDFAHRFAVLGPADYCVERLQGLAALGIERFGIIGGSPDIDAGAVEETSARFVEDVMPSLRG